MTTRPDPNPSNSLLGERMSDKKRRKVVVDDEEDTQGKESFEKDMQTKEHVEAAFQKEGASRTTKDNIKKQKKRAEPFKLRQKVVADKSECIVKKINKEYNCVLLERLNDGLCRWFDMAECNHILVDGKPVLEPKVELILVSTSPIENEKPTKSRIQVPVGPSSNFKEKMRKERHERRQRFLNAYNKLGKEKRILVEQLSIFFDGNYPSQEKYPTIFFDEELLQSQADYVCSLSETGATDTHIKYYPPNNNDWSEDGGTQLGSLPLRRFLHKNHCYTRWENVSIFVIPCVYLKNSKQ